MIQDVYQIRDTACKNNICVRKLPEAFFFFFLGGGGYISSPLKATTVHDIILDCPLCT